MSSVEVPKLLLKSGGATAWKGAEGRGGGKAKRQRRTVMLYIQVYQAILCQNNNFIAQLHLYGCLYRFLMAGAVQVAANFLVKPVDGHCPGFVPSYLP